MKKIKYLFVFVFVTVCLSACLFFTASAGDLDAPVLETGNVTSESVMLKWNKVKGAYAYKLFVLSKNGKEYVSLGATKNNYFYVDDLDGETEYTFKIKAFKLDENANRDFGELSDAFSVTTKLGTVSQIRLVKATTSALTVSWKAANGAEKYKVKYCRDGANSYKVAGETKKNSITIKGLSGNGKYNIRIAAIGKKSNSGYSKAFGVYCVPKKAEKPTLVSCDDHSLSFSWVSTKNANKYYIYAATSPDGKFKLIGETKKTSFVYITNKPSAVYYIRIAAVVETKNQKSIGKQSNTLKAATKQLTISGPSYVRCGEHPNFTASYYGSKVKWTSSDPNVLRVGKNDFRACSVGSATLSAEYKDSKVSMTVSVSAPVLRYMSCVYDYTNSRYIFDSRVNERCYPASITKLITALTAFQYMSLDDVVVVGSELNLVEPLSSRCGISYGEKFKFGDLLYGLLLPSGGDAAYTIAVNCARKASGNPNMGYVDAKNYFVSLMNQYMTSIGATSTHCVNPHGYPVNGHYTTVHDLVLVAKNVLANATLRSITSTSSKYVVALTGKGRTWSTTNGLINPGSSFYSPYAHGMKTGTVDDNYTGIVSAATKDGRTIITVVIGCESYNARYIATRTLYNYYL